MDIRTVLVVDDEPDIRIVADLSLRAIGGWQTTLVASGAEALAAIAARRPDLVILDVMMPEMDGPQTLAHIQADPGLKGLPVIFLTAKAQTRDIERFLALGAAGVLSKPFDPMQLPGQVRAITDALGEPQ